MTALSASAAGDVPPRLSDRPIRPRPWIEGALILAFWSAIALLTTGSQLQSPWNGTLSADQALRTIGRAFLTSYAWALLTPLIFWTSRRFTIERANWVSRVLQHVAIGVVIAITIDIYSDVLRFFVLPAAMPPHWTFDPLRATVRLWFLDDFFVYLTILGAGFARDYFLRYQARQQEALSLREQAARLEAQLVEARLQSLRMQLNPHFLFNTLHAVSSLVERDPAGVRRMIARLSELLRYTLEGSTKHEVSLRQELQFLDGYLEIQKIRFQGRLEVVREIDPAAQEALLPSLILQPLVENAVKHGAGCVDDVGRIVIRARREGAELVVRVEDNGPGIQQDDLRDATGGFGLRNTRDRLEALYGDAQRLSLARSDEGGVRAEIAVPYHTAADLHAHCLLQPA